MGNQSSASFKTKGHVLGTKEPPPTNNGKPAAPPPTTAKKQFGGLSLPAITTTKKSPPLTPEQIAERRRKLAEAAHARDKAWEDRINKKRQEREKQERNTMQQQPPPASSTPIDLGPIDPEIIKKQVEAERKLKESGFNPYEMTIANSSAARAALVLGGGGVAETLSTPSLLPISGSVSNNNNNKNTKKTNLEELENNARVDLLRAMEGNDKQMLASAIKVAEQYEIEDVLSARELLQVLNEEEFNSGENHHQTNEEIDLEALESNILLQVSHAIEELKKEADREAPINTLKKLLKNLVENPEELKFRRIKTGNKIIKETLIDKSKGKALLVLDAVGFQKQTADGEEFLFLPAPSEVDPKVLQVYTTAFQLALTLLE